MVTRRLALTLLSLTVALASSAIRQTLYADPENGYALFGRADAPCGQPLRTDSTVAIFPDNCGGDFSFAVRLRPVSSKRAGYTIAMTDGDCDTLRLKLTPVDGDDPLRDEEGTHFAVSRNGEPVASLSLPRKRFDLSGGNIGTLRIDRRGTTLTVSGGVDMDVRPIADLPPYDADVREISITPDGKSEIEIERAQLSAFVPAENLLTTGLTAEAVTDIAEEAPDAVCGVWTILDFDLDDVYMRPGGDYRLAVVPLQSLGGHLPAELRGVSSPAGSYAIIYLDGAGADAWRWTPGMLKGLLTPTPLNGTWRLKWYDSAGKAVGSDVVPSISTATLQDGGTMLNISFPERYSYIRLVRM